jgi:ABC-type Fe3+ transport system permease subunit
VSTAPVAFTLAAGLVAFGLLTTWLQLRGRAALRKRTHVPSDELAYLSGRYRRRLLTGVLLSVIGVLISTAFLSGLEPQIDELIDAAQKSKVENNGEGREMTPDQKQLVKVWGGYWTVVVVLVLVVFGLAFADALATRRYAVSQYRIIREDHEAKLRRDLAVHKAQHDARRNAIGGSGSEAEEDGTAG